MKEKDGLDIAAYFAGAHNQGLVSQEALQTLSVTADIGAQIQAGLGVSPDDVPASQVVLLTVMPDDSGSIAAAGNTELVRQGHNIVLDAMRGSKQRDGVLAHCRYLNGKVLYPYRMLDDAGEMDATNYSPDGGTPLFDQTVVVLGTVLAKALEFEDCGVPVRTITLLISDGGDTSSIQQVPKSVRALVDDMLRKECHIIAAMGIDDGSTDFRAVFSQMGIPDRWILTVKNTEKEIRKAFALFSKSAISASQGGAAFSQTAAGGFGAP